MFEFRWDGNAFFHSGHRFRFTVLRDFVGLNHVVCYFIETTYKSMFLENGSGPCGGGRKNRATSIKLICGLSNNIIRGKEPTECVYEIDFSLNCT